MHRAFIDTIGSIAERPDAPGRGFSRMTDLLLAAAVSIVKAHDVMLAQVRAGLHFDDLQGIIVGVLRPMAGAAPRGPI
jgi:hypothetical protein